MSELSITIHDLVKVYDKKKVSAKRRSGLKGLIDVARGRVSAPIETFRALDGVSFSARRGDRIGIVGRNGAGKSTLLKILSRVVMPSEGEVRIRGRLTSLLEVGTGFEMEATGRQNIYLNAGLHGLNRREISERFDDIVAFSGVGTFLDMPVKHYSSGMYMRLAFAIAAHLEPDILLLDEVLAVGDLAFQQKCLAKIEALSQDDDRTILFVSHSLGHVAQYCNKVLWLDAGRTRFFGDVTAGLQLYSDFMSPKAAESLAERRDRTGTGRARIERVFLQDDEGRPVDYMRTGEPTNIVVEWSATSIDPHDANDVFVNVILLNEHKKRLFGTPSDAVAGRLSIANGRGSFSCRIDRLPLLPGVYSYTVGILVDQQLVDKLDDAATFIVYDGDFHATGVLPSKQFGDIVLDYAWSVSERRSVDFVGSAA